MALPENRKRARSDDEKEARRGAILQATRVMIEAKGFEGITMNAIAQEAAVSKGTLYLYAASKEELLLALFVDAMEQVVARIEAEATADTLADVLVQVPATTPLFLPLLARLFAVIEKNVADEPLFENKRKMRDMGMRVASVIVRLTGAPLDQARAASMTLMLAMRGAAQSDVLARRDLTGIPEDLHPMFTKENFVTGYSVAVRMILAGLTRS
ncbi:TetR/AcrR family transcriptional regulator [Donghicola sp. C2-DW-16]|uniref:TetR/AcrR family transcriptional regulator n=1 Tax=Donghicola mangrovi TaxID=2729614 RepID=A0A850Q9K5_9RHOB|nr:TetR/AcrR family transcriptional regulator [Donghicola mangrovi]NVO25623.1 TetR/AcrR family transcriptional regulator [Donghicola mangrovi]NVO29481.1 TetR/AcrR family transcriptional regulator [Donghicola mangrovi]